MPETGAFADYKKRIALLMKETLAAKECQPILFVGAGLSRRYFQAPDWHGALATALKAVDDGGPDYEYYAQISKNDAVKIGTSLIERIHAWAWGKGKKSFPQDLYNEKFSPDIFIKHLISDNLIKITPKISKLTDKKLREEIGLLRDIRPHAVITTNFDTFLEKIYDGYEPIIGQKVIKYNMNSFG
ncbi:hypothetical protein [Microvirga brassicacearum]|uniref:SIR2-like domain-containing protein n=1 Tax=Microvirga brassicacearum TaxID=2580413 RepID=A0A5N3PA17_9HYPH|nr:hypothetical protein [Microvirga brassicacearum]KAB0266596.1 hypothetical protein FEZ63_13235 [Microvirga brassicacearum]